MLSDKHTSLLLHFATEIMNIDIANSRSNSKFMNYVKLCTTVLFWYIGCVFTNTI